MKRLGKNVLILMVGLFLIQPGYSQLEKKIMRLNEQEKVAPLIPDNTRINKSIKEYLELNKGQLSAPRISRKTRSHQNKRLSKIHPTPNSIVNNPDNTIKVSNSKLNDEEKTPVVFPQRFEKRKENELDTNTRSNGSSYQNINNAQPIERSVPNVNIQNSTRSYLTPTPNSIEWDAQDNETDQFQPHNEELSDRTFYLQEGYYPQIAVSENGDIYAVLSGFRPDLTDSLAIRILKSVDNGETWESFGTVYSTTADLYDPDIETLDDRLLVAYERDGLMRVFYLYYDWSSYDFITVATTDYGLPSLISDKFYYPLETTWTYLTYYSEESGVANIYYSTSTDQGLTWSTPIQLSNDNAYWVSAGNAVAYSLGVQGVDEYCVIGWMDNTGSTIVSRVNIYTDAYDNTTVMESGDDYYFNAPSVAAYYENIFVTTSVDWGETNTDVALTFSSDNGETWGADYDWYYWIDNYDIPDNAPVCTFGSDGTLGFIWLRGSSIFYRTNNSQNWLSDWSMETLVDNDVEDNWSTACVISGDVFHATYDEGESGNIYYKQLSLDPVESFGEYVNDGYYPQVSLAENGDIYVAFSEYDESISDYLLIGVYRSQDGGESWNRHTYVYNSSEHLESPDIEVLEDRYVITFKLGTSMYVGYVKLDDISDYLFTALSNSVEDDAYGSIVSDKSYYGLDLTYTYVTYIVDESSGTNIYYTSSTDQGDSWAEPVLLTENYEAMDISIGNNIAYSMSDDGEDEFCQIGWRELYGDLIITNVNVYDDADFSHEIIMEADYDNNTQTWNYWFWPPSVSAYYSDIIISTTVVWHQEDERDIAITFSSDNGESWGSDYAWYYWGEEYDIPDDDPVSTFSPDGSLGFVWVKGNYVYYRSNGTDDWLSGWSDELLIDNSVDDIYSTGCVISDNVFHAVYDEGEEGNIYYGSLEMDSGGTVSMDEENNILPISNVLYDCYPNPFNPVTTLRYDLPKDAMVNITIYDMMGRVIKTMVNSHQNAGFKSIQWNATTDEGKPASAGLYLYTIQAGDFRQSKKMVLLK